MAGRRLVAAGKKTGAPGSPKATGPGAARVSAPARTGSGLLDIAGLAALALAGAVAALALPPGGLRLALTLPALLLAPGYLLLEAVTPRASRAAVPRDGATSAFVMHPAPSASTAASLPPPTPTGPPVGATAHPRTLHLLVAIGLSPALVALLALSTAFVDGGFRPVPIVVVTTLGTLAFAAVAATRRLRGARLPPSPTHLATANQA